MPAQAGIQKCSDEKLDARLRGHDRKNSPTAQLTNQLFNEILNPERRIKWQKDWKFINARPAAILLRFCMAAAVNWCAVGTRWCD
jgi:hypothetical protein